MRVLAFCLALCACSSGEVSATKDTGAQVSRKVADAFDAGDGWQETGLALDSIFRTAERALRERQQHGEAAVMADEWALYKARYFGAGMQPTDMGDHAPLSQWLARQYAIMEGLLGHQLCVLLHLTDIAIINFTVPVVFNAKSTEHWCFENMVQHPNDTCQAEYRRHFAGTNWQAPDRYARDPHHDGLLGVAVYWTIFGACEAATYGTGWFVLCSPAANAGEILTEKYLAAPLSDKVYGRANP